MIIIPNPPSIKLTRRARIKFCIQHRVGGVDRILQIYESVAKKKHNRSVVYM
jgi:hypothetical protein